MHTYIHTRTASDLGPALAATDTTLVRTPSVIALRLHLTRQALISDTDPPGPFAFYLSGRLRVLGPD